MREKEEKKSLQIELTLCSWPPRKPARRVPPLALSPIGWISSSFPGCLLLKQRLLCKTCTVCMFSLMRLYFCIIWEPGYKLTPPTKQTNIKKTPQSSFSNVSLDKNPLETFYSSFYSEQNQQNEILNRLIIYQCRFHWVWVWVDWKQNEFIWCITK